MNNDKIILDLCGGTGAWSKPYKDAGYTVYVLTLPKFNVLEWKDDRAFMDVINSGKVYGILAAPPCTMFSMARTKAKTPRDLKGAMETVKACLEIVWACQDNGSKLAFWAMENPKARLRWFMGIPALTFNPYDYGDPYQKPTDLWGNFNTRLRRNFILMDSESRKRSQKNTQALQELPDEYVIDPGMSKTAIRRSMTHPGFAQAFFNANK